MTSTIRHVVTSKDIQFADGRVKVPDVVVDVINSDYDAIPTGVVISKETGGLIGVQWDAPASALQPDSGVYNYALEVTKGALVAPTVIEANATCDTPGCTANLNVDFDMAGNVLRAAFLTVRIRQTDFDADEEAIESIVVNGDTIRTNCLVGGDNVGGSICADVVKHQAPACVNNYQLNSSLIGGNIGNIGNIASMGALSISIKASSEVDKSNCLDDSFSLVHADIYLTLMYKSDDEVYFGPKLT